MSKRKGLDSLTALNPLFGAATQGGTTSREIHAMKDGPEPSKEFRQPDNTGKVHVRVKKPASIVRPKTRERHTTRPR